MFTRQQYLAQECTHAQYWAQFVTERIKSSILTVFTPAEIKQSKDPHMNDLPREKWDLIVNSTTPTNKLKEACKPHNVSQSDINSVVKEAARQLQQELNNQPKKAPAMNGILQKLEATADETQAKDANLFRKQKYTTPWRTVKDTKCRAFIRFDDQCCNGHNSFSITGETREFYDNRWHEGSGGSIHEEVTQFFPELAPFTMWHLTSSDGPMYYIANTTYHAGDKDCWGRRKGEVASTATHIKFGNFPITLPLMKSLKDFLATRTDFKEPELVIIEVPYTKEPGKYEPEYAFEGMDTAWAYAPFKTRPQALQWKEALEIYPYEIVEVPTSYSKGKPRDLGAARNTACWPEATDEELCSDNLEELLKARHLALMQKFKDAIQELGLAWAPVQENTNA